MADARHPARLRHRRRCLRGAAVALVRPDRLPARVLRRSPRHHPLGGCRSPAAAPDPPGRRRRGHRAPRARRPDGPGTPHRSSDQPKLQELREQLPQAIDGVERWVQQRGGGVADLIQAGSEAARQPAGHRAGAAGYAAQAEQRSGGRGGQGPRGRPAPGADPTARRRGPPLLLGVLVHGGGRWAGSSSCSSWPSSWRSIPASIIAVSCTSSPIGRDGRPGRC